MSCSEKPLFVIVKQTSTGYSFDNDVVYKSPFATHTLTQESGMLHPSLVVKSNWGFDKSKSIISMITGESGAETLKKGTNKNIVVTKSVKGTILSKVGLLKNHASGGYTLARFNGSGTGDAPSVAELASVLNSLSKTPGNIKVRGSPLEYKRLLDYTQFIMTQKVTSDKQLYLARPNNVHVMDNIRDRNASLEDVYIDIFNSDDNNSKMYNRAYFVSYDRVAALASVVRDIPTLYQIGFSKINPLSKSFCLIESTNNIRAIQNIIKSDILETPGFTLYNANKGPHVNGHSNRKQILLYKNRPLVTSGPLFQWFFNTRNVASKDENGKTRNIGSDFHRMPVANKVKVLFYWVFNYPKPGIGGGDGNATVIEYFLSILDTFHDFAKRDFEGLWPEKKNEAIHNRAKTKTENAITNANIPRTNVSHKFLVDLLGIDIYRKAREQQYSSNIVATLSKTNTRKIDPQMKVAHFLFFITNILGSQSSRLLIDECENYAKDIMVKLAGNAPIENETMCQKLEDSGSCLVVDAISGRLPECMRPYSVYHNVAVLDPANKDVLSWGEVTGNGECIESAKEKELKRKEKKKWKRQLRNKKDRAVKAKATRIKRKELELLEKQRIEKMRKNQENRQKRGRAERIALRRGIGAQKPNTPVANGAQKPNTPVANGAQKSNALVNNGRNLTRVTRAGTPFAKPRTPNVNTPGSAKPRTPNVTPKTSGINMFGMRKEPNLPQGKLNMFGMRR